MATKYGKIETNLFVLAGQDDGFDPTGWNGLPEYNDKDNEAPYTLVVTVESTENLHKLADLIGQQNLKNDTKRFTKSIWHPQLVLGERGSNVMYVWMDEEDIPKDLK